jgi:DNA-binding transcriptional LysR family regulator
MDIESLRIVALVERQGSFASAARVLNVDPSSVSRHVAVVEAALGLRLFQRTTRSLRLTEEGAVFLGRIPALIEEFDRARDEAAAIRRGPRGTLRMTASVAFADVRIVPHLGAFRDRYPGLAVELLPTDANLDLAAAGIDLAVRLAPAPKGDLVSTRLMVTRYLVCASPDWIARHPPLAEPGELAGHDCLRFSLPEFRTRWLFRRGAEEPFEVPIGGSILIGSALSLRQAAVAGLGPVLLADWLVAEDIRAGRLVRLFPDHDATATSFDTAAWLLYPSRSFLPRKVRVMIDFLRETVGVG